jgi:hypothetical protein
METLFSSKTIDPNRLYCLAVTFEIDYNNDLTDISLYLDGLLDSQITVPGEPMHNQGNLYIGKVDNMNYGFSGFVADVMLIPRVLQAEEVNLIFRGCIYNLNVHKAPRSYDIVGRKLERDVLLERYSKHSSIPMPLLENLDMTNEELREVVKKYENVEENQQVMEINEINTHEQDSKILEKFSEFLGSEDNDICINIKKITINVRFIYTILFLSAEDLNFEVERIMNIFDVLKETLHIAIEQKDLIELAKIFKVYTKDGSRIKIDDFFKKLKFYMSILFPDIKGSSHLGDSRTDDFNCVELHENLLLNSQNFKNYIDDDFERDLAKSTFTIRSLYSRGKSAGRPITGKMQTNNDDDMVQQYGFDDIPEKKNEYEEDDEEENIENKSQDMYAKEQINRDESSEGKRKGSNSSNKSNKSKKKIDNEPQFIDEQIDDENKSAKAKSHVSEKSNKSKKEAEEKKENEIHEGKLVKEEDTFKPEIVNEEHGVVVTKEKDPLQDTENKDFVISNLDNKVILEGSQGFENENMIAINNLNELEKQEQEEAQKNEEKSELEPKFPEDWNQGAFEVVVNHCYDCHKHKTTTRHYEFVKIFIYFRHLYRSLIIYVIH